MCRHTLVALERGQLSTTAADEALQLALATIRDHHGGESVRDDEFREVLAEEEKRVADAAVLAELIVARLPAPSPAGAAPAPSIPAAWPVPTTERTRGEPVPPPTFSPATPGHLPDIADMIDGMIAQERSSPRRHNP